MMMLVAWLALLFSIFRSVYSCPPREICGYTKIAVSNSGEFVAAVHRRGIHLFGNDKYIDELNVGHVDSLKFVDDNTLAITCLQGDLPCGVHFYSLDQRKVTRWLPLKSNRYCYVRLLDDKFIVHQIDQKYGAQIHVYDMDASKDSKPIASYPPPPTNMPFDATNDGRYIVFHLRTVQSNDFALWKNATVANDLEKGESTNSLGMSNGAAFSPDGSFVITCTENITKFNWPSAEPQWSISCDEPCGRIRISNNGERFAVLTGTDYANQGRYLRVFDSDSSKQLLEIELNESLGLGFTLSEDGQSVWTGPLDEQRGLIQWDVDSNSIVKRIGSQQKFGTLAYIALFLLWAVLYGKLFTKRTVIPSKSSVTIAFIFGLIGLKQSRWVLLKAFGILLLAFGCDMAYWSRHPYQIAFTSLLLVAGSVFVIKSIRLFFAKEDAKNAKDLSAPTT